MIYLIVEGDSDKILFENQMEWFKSFGFELTIITAGGKTNMIKKARSHYNVAILSGAKNVIFLPDQLGDDCAIITRQQIGMNSMPQVATIVMKQELEAWILADGICIENSVGLSYSPPGQTDTENFPKNRLRSLLNRKLGYLPTTVEASSIVAPHFSIDRAASNNTSAKRFKDFIERISCRNIND